MENKQTYFELIDAYFSNGLTSAEKLKFNALLEHDPAFKQEFIFQKNLIEELQNIRKSELKVRLNNIPVSGSSIISAAQVKLVAASILIASLLSVGYYLYRKNNNNEVLEQDLSFLPKKDKSSVDTKFITPNNNETITIQNVPVIKNNEFDNLNKESAESEEEKMTAPVLPEINEVLLEPKIIREEHLNNNDNIVNSYVKPEITKVEIEIKAQKPYNFHYQYFNNKLFLYGSFQGIPYEIIEVKAQKGKNLFMKYSDTFYLIKPTKPGKIRPFTPIQDKQLLKELEIIINKDN